MSALYHINPETGRPGVCHAQNGNCPYKGQTEHYSTFEEAQAVADSIQSDRFSQFEEQVPHFSYPFASSYAYLEQMSKKDILEEIKNTQDPMLLNDVLNGVILVRGSDTDYIEQALQNPHLDDAVMWNMMDNPQNYSDNAILALSNNPRLTDRHRFYLLWHAPEDRNFADNLLRNPKISSESLANVIDDFMGDNEYNLPPLICRATMNKNCPPKQAALFKNRNKEFAARAKGYMW